MEIFKFWGLKGGEFQFSLTKPYKECACHQNASFKPLMAIIGPTGGPVAMSMKLKNLKNSLNRRLTMTISRMRRHAPFGPTDPNFCLWGGVTDIINCAKFFENRFRGSGEEEEDIYLTQINNNHGYSTPIVTEPGCQKTRRSTMLATHIIQELLTYIQKNKHTSMHQ